MTSGLKIRKNEQNIATFKQPLVYKQKLTFTLKKKR